MNNVIKRHIKLITEKYDHALTYDRSRLIINSEKNHIEIEEAGKDQFCLKYNTNEGVETITIAQEDVFDVLIALYTRWETTRVDEKRGELLKMAHFLEEEGKGAEKRLKQLRLDLKNNELNYRHLGDNRIEAEYFKGVIILKDDIMAYKSNVVDFE